MTMRNILMLILVRSRYFNLVDIKVVSFRESGSNRRISCNTFLNICRNLSYYRRSVPPLEYEIDFVGMDSRATRELRESSVLIISICLPLSESKGGQVETRASGLALD